MAHGYPDYLVASPKSKLYAGVDSAELAARLGSMARYDRYGDTVFFEGFEGDLGAWKPETSGTGASVVISAARKVTGGFSCKLTCGSDASAYARIGLFLPHPYSLIYGVEWQQTLDSNLQYIKMRFYAYTGALSKLYSIRYFCIAGTYAGLARSIGDIDIYKGDGTFQLIGNAVPLMSTYFAMVFKVTVNVEDWKYSRLVIPPRSFDISSYEPYSVADATAESLEVWIEAWGKQLENAVSYVDNAIVTVNDV